MARLRIAPIVEGDGELASIRILLERICTEELGGEYPVVLKPTLKSKSWLITKTGLHQSFEMALEKLSDESRSNPLDSSLVLILLDADIEPDDPPPAELESRLLAWAQEVDPRVDVVCVAAYVEYETWFVASAQSLIDQGFLRLKAGEVIPTDPEGRKLRKKWIEDRFIPREQRGQGRDEVGKKGRYSPTRDQAAMTKAMNLKQCRDRSPSFDKLCRELEKRIVPSGHHE